MVTNIRCFRSSPAKGGQVVFIFSECAPHSGSVLSTELREARPGLLYRALQVLERVAGQPAQRAGVG